MRAAACWSRWRRSVRWRWASLAISCCIRESCRESRDRAVERLRRRGPFLAGLEVREDLFDFLLNADLEFDFGFSIHGVAVILTKQQQRHLAGADQAGGGAAKDELADG
jgi:hypothetical protein